MSVLRLVSLLSDAIRIRTVHKCFATIWALILKLSPEPFEKLAINETANVRIRPQRAQKCLTIII